MKITVNAERKKIVTYVLPKNMTGVTPREQKFSFGEYPDFAELQLISDTAQPILGRWRAIFQHWHVAHY